MREETVTYKVFKYDELSDDAKQKALEQFSDINSGYDWWDSGYNYFKEQLNYIGITSTSNTYYFDLDRNLHIVMDKPRICDIDKLLAAISYLKVKSAIKELLDLDFMNGNTTNHIVDSGYGYSSHKRIAAAIDNIVTRADELLQDRLHDFARSLQEESEYLGSKEAIEETIKCNDYEFSENGKLYR